MSDYDREMTAAAYAFAWEGYQKAEIAASKQFSTAVSFLPEDPVESYEDAEIVNSADGMVVTMQETQSTYPLVDISETLAHGARCAVLLGRTATYVSMVPEIEGTGTVSLEVIMSDSAIVLDTSFEPPVPTGEEYHRPSITVTLAENGEDVTGVHFTSAEQPDTIETLQDFREDQKRYASLLGLVVMTRVARGEIADPEQ